MNTNKPKFTSLLRKKNTNIMIFQGYDDRNPMWAILKIDNLKLPLLRPSTAISFEKLKDIADIIFVGLGEVYPSDEIIEKTKSFYST